MTYGVTTSGFTIKTLQNIVDENNQKVWGYWPQLNVTPPSITGTWIGIFADGLSEAWEMGQDLYNIFDPDSATGVALDRIGALKGVPRYAATYSVVSVTFTGTNGTNIPAGTVVAVLGDEDTTFETNSLVTLAGAGPFTATVNATCTIAGAIQGLVGTVSVIVTPINGVTSVTNAAVASLGRALETDAEYRLRINSLGTNVEKVTVYGIEQGIYKLNDSNPSLPTITNAYVIENDTDVAVGSRPPHSVELFTYLNNPTQDVRDDEIAAKLQLIKGGGIETYGTITKSVIDYKGISRTVKFSRVTEVPIYATITFTYDVDEAPADIQAQIKANVLAWGNALGAGTDVIVNGYASLENTIGQTVGVTSIISLVGIAPNPTLSNNIIIDDGSAGSLEISTWASENVTVTPA